MDLFIFSDKITSVHKENEIKLSILQRRLLTALAKIQCDVIEVNRKESSITIDTGRQIENFPVRMPLKFEEDFDMMEK